MFVGLLRLRFLRQLWFWLFIKNEYSNILFSRGDKSLSPHVKYCQIMNYAAVRDFAPVAQRCTFRQDRDENKIHHCWRYGTVLPGRPMVEKGRQRAVPLQLHFACILQQGEHRRRLALYGNLKGNAKLSNRANDVLIAPIFWRKFIFWKIRFVENFTSSNYSKLTDFRQNRLKGEKSVP